MKKYLDALCFFVFSLSFIIYFLLSIMCWCRHDFLSSLVLRTQRVLVDVIAGADDQKAEQKQTKI